MARAPWLNSSVTKNQGMEPGPVANMTTNRMTKTMQRYDTQVTVCQLKQKH
jgi:hypothetical protein